VNNEADQSGRILIAGSTGDNINQDKTCFLISAKYNVTPTNAVGDLVFAAMGYNIAGFKFPWTAVGYIRGSASVKVDASTDGGKPLTTISAEAQAAVAAWAWTELVEFCDNNGVEGFQFNPSGDSVINRIPAWLGSFTLDCGASPGRYYATIQSLPIGGATNSNFNTTCEVFASPTTKNGKLISNYHMKCDLNLDVSNLWYAFPTACPDTKRKFGIALVVAGAAFDVNVQTSNLNSVGGTGENQVTFNSGALAFAWDNYYKKPAGFKGTVGVVGGVKAVYFNNTNVEYAGAKAAAVVLFSFDSPKSAGTNYFYWDPTTKVTASSTSLVASLLLLAFTLLNGLF